MTVILEPANGSGKCLFLQESHLLTAMHIVWNINMIVMNNAEVCLAIKDTMQIIMCKFCVFFVLSVSHCVILLVYGLVGRLGHWVCKESWACKGLFNLLPQVSVLSTQGAAKLLIVFVILCEFDVCVWFYR